MRKQNAFCVYDKVPRYIMYSWPMSPSDIRDAGLFQDHAVDIVKPVFLSPYPCRRWKNIVIITEKIKAFI